MTGTRVAGGTLVVPEDGLDLREACYAVVRLLSVVYAGNNIGRRWSWNVLVDGGIHDHPEHDFLHGSIEQVNTDLLDRQVGPCGASFRLRFRVTARRHAGSSTTSGVGVTQPSFGCPAAEQVVQQPVTIAVFVRRWWWLPWPRAILAFRFVVQTSCAPASITLPP